MKQIFTIIIMLCIIAAPCATAADIAAADFAASELVTADVDPLPFTADTLPAPIDTDLLAAAVPAESPAALSESLAIPAESLTVTLSVNGQAVNVSPAPFVSGGVTFVPLRAMCELLGNGVNVAWNGETQTVSVTTPPLTVTLNINDSFVIANGRYIYNPDGCKVIGGITFVPVRVLAKAFNAAVEWNGGVIDIVTSDSVITSGDLFYDSDTLYWLSRIISAEARGECLDGQIGVGNVVLNRVDYEYYPDTVHGVVFDRVGGIQFTPVANGSIKDEPTESAVIAAKLVLDGANTAEDSLFFFNPRIASNNWIARTRKFCKSIGNHDFYY